MLFFSDIKMRLAAIVLIAGICAFAQAPKRQTGAPNVPKPAGAAAQTTEPKFKAIWEPANVKEDIELQAVHFTSPEEGWVAGGRTAVEGGVIFHTANGGATWEVQLGDPQSSDRPYHDLRFLGPTMGWAVQNTGVGDHKLLRTDGKYRTDNDDERPGGIFHESPPETRRAGLRASTRPFACSLPSRPGNVTMERCGRKATKKHLSLRPSRLPSRRSLNCWRANVGPLRSRAASVISRTRSH